MKLLVTGSRKWLDSGLVVDALCLFLYSQLNSPGDFVIVHGHCPTGADHIADLWGESHADKVKRYPAQWNLYGSAAGPMRNREMINENPNIDYVLAFPLEDSKGTRDCMAYAKEKGLTVIDLGERERF
ncbi:SLOG family protein [Actinomadura rubrisoli]|uniref:DUF2493 domain-containing protein n=1 Tax=Actinomadura rubrisoli TaxID=2530368 RepID=A0A4R5CG06_9ACTN|nr:SLOG family protein [Actinomadura rubrisoli]TDD97213.1 DUF2493 domain-containing protein [Actinomadura rubrisoli]